MTLQAWINMLETLCHPGESRDRGIDGNPAPASAGATDSEFVDWMEVERLNGKAVDVGLYRHWVDPMKPFAASVRPHLHGMAVTSATLSATTRKTGIMRQAPHRRGLFNGSTRSSSRWNRRLITPQADENFRHQRCTQG
jgi:Rad3-related DNA helicase